MDTVGGGLRRSSFGRPHQTTSTVHFCTLITDVFNPLPLARSYTIHIDITRFQFNADNKQTES